MRRSLAAPATEAPARHNAALRQRRLRQRRGPGRGGGEPEPAAGARAAERRHHAGSGSRVLLAALRLGDLPPGKLRSGRRRLTEGAGEGGRKPLPGAPEHRATASHLPLGRRGRNLARPAQHTGAGPPWRPAADSRGQGKLPGGCLWNIVHS
ncbi:PH domain leucine-rich repeat-containing protein phosphatase 1-like [Onychomys torridus]|uniref:PH domain leucine-rich repeat-containing protein phosphatase 1-like n=1 Tax=Onychomys torridus TaxID=38674 RepID=UPI00167F6850|nr:PH domain leucine-rich repeat-containing protein phosphatase 1-like [Onychomys torridus]